MQEFYKFITWGLCLAQHVSGASTPIIMSLQPARFDVYVCLKMFRAPPRPSSGVYNCINSLWFYRWSVGGSSAVGCGLAGDNRPDHNQQHCYHQRSNGKTKGC